MLGPNKLSEIANLIFSLSKADQTEVILRNTDSALTRFANNQIHQNVAESDSQVRVRVVYGKRIGVASSNDLSPDALKRTLETARAIAQRQRADPEFKSLPPPQPIQNVEVFVDATAQSTPEQRAQAVGILCKRAKEKGVVAAGAFETTAIETVVANSLGVFAYHPVTYADLNTVMMSDTGSGYASFTHQDARQVNAEALAREAIDKALRARNPITLDPGEYTVFLEEYAVTDILDFLNYAAFSAQAVQEDRSFMKGKFGQKVMDERVTIYDDGLASDTLAMPFDFEGVPRQKVMLIENGIARGVVHDTTTAQREGVASTGHALPAPNTLGPFALHMVLSPGNTPKSEMLKSIERGIWVTRFWYTRIVHPMKVLITGLTRDGTFLIENGEVTQPIKNLRFTTSYLDALNNVRALGDATKLFFEGWSHASRRVPALAVDRFRFTGTTQ